MQKLLAMRDLVDPMSFAVFTLAGCSMPGTGYRARPVPGLRWTSLDAAPSLDAKPSPVAPPYPPGATRALP